jgi:T5orf172 domain
MTAERKEYMRVYSQMYRAKNRQKCAAYGLKRHARHREKTGKPIRKLKLSPEEFINRLAVKDNTIRVDSEYRGARFQIDVTCLVCQHKWRSHAGSLLYNDGACKQCFLNRIRGKVSAKRIKHDDFVNRLRAVNDTIQIDNVYTTAFETINASCLKCGHKWTPFPRTVLRGGGCPKCSPYGFRQDKAGFLYYVRILVNGELFYKIGITNRTVPKRFKQDYAKLTVLETVWCENGAEAFEMEREILNEYRKYRYRGPRILDSGNREIFVKDILNLDVWKN